MLYGLSFHYKNKNLSLALIILVCALIVSVFAFAKPAVAFGPVVPSKPAGKDCTYAYSSDKKKITSDCEDKNDLFEKKTFARTANNRYQLKIGSCTATINSTLSNPSKGKLSGKVPTPSGNSCKSLDGGNITINVDSSNEEVRANAAAAALIKSSSPALVKLSGKSKSAVDAAIKKCTSNAYKNGGAILNLNSAGAATVRNTIVNCLANEGLGSKAAISKIVTTAKVKAALDGAVNAAVDEDGDDSGEEEDVTTCNIDGVGWMVCPVMNFLAKLNDKAFSFLSSLLTVQPKIFNDPATSKAWAAFRDIANVAFVVSFLVIVYSQLTGMGVSNYGIKKLLPRIFIAAVLVNLSFVICALAVDFSNIVGGSVFALLGNSISLEATSADGTSTWETIASSALSVGAVVAVFLLIILAPTVLLAAALILLILVARQALVILLIVIAPLAFVAYLLPNTEDWFKRWRKAFTTTLLVFPIVGLVFGASTLASRILMSVAGSNEGGTNDDSQLLAIVALAVMAVPLFAVPVLLKGALSATGSIGQRISNLSDKTNRMALNQGKRNAQDANNRFKIAAQDPENKWGRRLGGYSRWKNNRDMGRKDRENAANRAAELGYATSMIEKDSNDNFTARAKRMQQAAAGGAGVANQKAMVRAEALATQRTFKQMDDDVAAFQTTQTNLTHEDLVKKQTNENLSLEERAAAAGTIAKREWREGHNDSLKNMHSQMAEADDALLKAQADHEKAKKSGDTKSMADAQAEINAANAKIETQNAIQKQFKAQWKEKSFGMSDTAMGELGEGKYGRMNERKNADGEIEIKRSKDIYAGTRERAETKLNEQGLVTMNPDDLTLIVKAAEAPVDSGEELEEHQLRTVMEKITSARANKETSKLIKKEAEVKFERIFEAARKRGIPLPGEGGSSPGGASGPAAGGGDGTVISWK